MEVFIIIVSIPGITIIIILFWLFNLEFKLACMLWKRLKFMISSKIGMFKNATYSHQDQLLTHSTVLQLRLLRYAPVVLTADYIL